MRYRVKWEIDIEAGTPEQAAQQALAIQRDPESTATVFEVLGFISPVICKSYRIDLGEEA